MLFLTSDMPSVPDSEKGWLRSSGFDSYKLSALGGMINASVNNRYCKKINQNWLDHFGTINIPVGFVRNYLL